MLNVVHNSRNLWFLALDCWVDDVDKGAASPADGCDQQKVQRLLGRQKICPVPLPDSLQNIRTWMCLYVISLPNSV